MLSVNGAWRKRGIASTLVKLSADMMMRMGADEIILETEVDNSAALALYSSLGFIREKRLYRFYMNGKDAFRLVLPVLPSENLVTEETPTGGIHIPTTDGLEYDYFDHEVASFNIPSSISPPLPPRSLSHRATPVYDSDDESYVSRR